MPEQARDESEERSNAPDQAPRYDDLDYWWSPDDPMNKLAKERTEKLEQEVLANARTDNYLILDPNAPPSALELGLRWGTPEWKEAEERWRDYFDKHPDVAGSSTDITQPGNPPIEPGPEEHTGPANDIRQQPE